MFTMPSAHDNTQILRIMYTEDDACRRLSDALSPILHAAKGELVLVCIGTDRSTGDSLGPLVGSRLQQLRPDGCVVYGTLDQPVHAINLPDTINEIRSMYPSAMVLAVDACLGQAQSVGAVTVHRGPLKPGAGVNKELPEVGHAHITGIVNVGGFMEYFVLQNTRLSIVIKMADCIAQALSFAVARKNVERSNGRAPSVRKHDFFLERISGAYGSS